MKRLILFFVTILTLSLSAMAAQRKVNVNTTNSGNIVTKTFNSQVMSVESNVVCTFILKKSNTPRIVARAPQRIMDKTVMTVSHGILTLSFKNSERDTDNSTNKDNALVIEIEQPDLKLLTNNGVVTMTGGGSFKESAITINNNGVLTLSLMNLQCKSLSIFNNGVSHAEISGTASDALFHVNGNGSINAFDFICKNVNAAVSGVGSIECHAEGVLKADVSGIGDIYYKGRPAKIISNTKSTKIHDKSEPSKIKSSKNKARSGKQTEPSVPAKKRKVLIL